MKEKNLLQLDPSSIHVRLGMCAAALAGTAAAVPNADAVIITFNTPINVPATFAGVYLNLETGVQGNVPGWDFNPYLVTTSGALGFYWSPDLSGGLRGGGVAADPTTGPYLDLAVGTVVGPASTYTSAIQGTNGSPFLTTGTHILGFQFVNALGTLDYGYVTMSNTASSATTSLPSIADPSTNRGGRPGGAVPTTPPGFPMTITSWSYDNTGAAITIVPEPSTVGLLTISALAAGALGLRKWRRNRIA